MNKKIKIAHSIICKSKGNEYAPNKDELQDIINRLVFHKGFWYLYVHKLARHRKDYCVASKNPQEYNNGYYLYSDKDPGSGKEFVIIETNNPVLMAQIIINQQGGK